MTTRHIVINGWYGHDNAGDDAILEVFIAETLALAPHSDIVVLSQHPERVAALFGSARVTAAHHPHLKLPHAWREWLNGDALHHVALMRRTDLFVLGGGGLMRDNTTWRNLTRLLDEIHLAHRLGKRVALFALGVGPFVSARGQQAIRKAVEKCELITVRDQTSQRLLLQLGIAEERLHVVGDPAFLLQATPVDDPEVIGWCKRPHAVGLFPSLGFINDGHDLSHIPALAAALDHLHQHHGLEFVVLPMRWTSGMDDRHVGRLIGQQMKHPQAIHIHEGYLSPSQIKWLSGLFRFNITVRLHAMIFSLGMGVPVAAINYEPKVANVLEAYGKAQYRVDMGATMTERLIEVVERLVLTHEEESLQVRHLLPVQMDAARRTFQLFSSLLA